ncbi:MAG: cysteine desulfurase [Phycisphaeraceae bacterium]|nr:cysteine desulfurase [Phycisphaeraceae bacterium]
MEWIYLDNNATTRPEEKVKAALAVAQEEYWANPSSVHRLGQAVRQQVELARASVAELIGCRAREVVFTSGGTEANNLALRGVWGGGGKYPPAEPGAETGNTHSTLRDAVWHPNDGTPGETDKHPPHAAGYMKTLPGAGKVREEKVESREEREKTLPGAGVISGVVVTSRIEHAAIRGPVEELARQGVEVRYLPVRAGGRIDPGDLRAVLAELVGRVARVLVSIQWANNETGTLQPVTELARVCREAGRGVLFHVDGTQAVGKIAVDVKAVGMDLMTLAGHKFHGPKGVGALYVKSGVKLRAQQTGGPQERELRGGTENVAGIIGLGVAAELARDFVADGARVEGLRKLRDRLEKGIIEALPGTVVNGVGEDGTQRLWNTTNLGFPRLEAEAILIGLSERGVYASAGAACSSGSLEPSPVLLAMGIAEEVAHGSVRFSLSRMTEKEDVEEAIGKVRQVVELLRKTLPVG